MKNNINRANPFDLKTLSLLIVSIISVYFIFNYYTEPKYYLNNEDSSPMLPSIWSEVGKSETVKVYVDISNINKQEGSAVKFWEKIEFISDFTVANDINNDLILKFDGPLKNTTTRFLVDCDAQNYQTLNAIYTQRNGKVRYMRTDQAPLPPAKIEKTSLKYSSAQYACAAKDMTTEEKIATVSYL